MGLNEEFFRNCLGFLVPYPWRTHLLVAEPPWMSLHATIWSQKRTHVPSLFPPAKWTFSKIFSHQNSLCVYCLSTPRFISVLYALIALYYQYSNWQFWVRLRWNLAFEILFVCCRVWLGFSRMLFLHSWFLTRNRLENGNKGTWLQETFDLWQYVDACRSEWDSLTPWHYSPDGRKPPLIRFHSLIQWD
jgi:hypothetical protein